MIHVRAAKPEDCVAIADLHRRAIQETNGAHYSAEEIAHWSKVTSDGHARSLTKTYKVVAEDERGIIGFGDACDGTVHGLYVHPKHQKTGAGKVILANLEEELRAHGSTVATLDATRAARTFYEQQGYAVIEERSTTVRGVPIPGFLMRKKL